MNRSTQRQRHEQARKRHKHDQQQHAREAAKQPRSAFPRWLLVGGVLLILAFVLDFSFGR